MTTCCIVVFADEYVALDLRQIGWSGDNNAVLHQSEVLVAYVRQEMDP